MKTVGIIGGLGPETTAKFNLEIISTCFRSNKEKRPPMLSWNVPISFAVEEQLITKNKSSEQYLPLLIDAAKRLEKAGADFLVMPCNSMHIFIQNIRDSVNVPVLSIIDEITRTLKEQNISDVGILATQTTIESNLFQNSFQKNQIEFKLPSKSTQKRLNKLIQRILSGRQTLEDKSLITKISSSIDTQIIILACTDLQLLSKKLENVKVIDTMDVLAEAAAREILRGGEKIWHQ